MIWTGTGELETRTPLLAPAPAPPVDATLRRIIAVTEPIAVDHDLLPLVGGMTIAIGDPDATTMIIEGVRPRLTVLATNLAPPALALRMKILLVVLMMTERLTAVTIVGITATLPLLNRANDHLPLPVVLILRNRERHSLLPHPPPVLRIAPLRTEQHDWLLCRKMRMTSNQHERLVSPPSLLQNRRNMRRKK